MKVNKYVSTRLDYISTKKEARFRRTLKERLKNNKSYQSYFNVANKEKGRTLSKLQLRSKFILSFLITITASSKVVNFTQVPLMFSVLKTCRLNCPKVLFHKLKEEGLLSLTGTTFSKRKPCTRKGFLPLNENGKIDSRDETVLEGDFEKKVRLES